MSKYSQIRNIDELESALKDVKMSLGGKKVEISDNLYGLRESYSPTNLLGMGLKSASTSYPIDKYLLDKVRKLKSFFSK